jgi:5'-nucleotidase / UDP-sugar diphosphatase
MKRFIPFIYGVFLCGLLVTSAQAAPSSIRILYVNDFHGFAEPYEPLGSGEALGGIAYLAADARRLGKEKPSLFLSAGDMIQGSNWTNLFRGASVIEAMNEMRFDAMVVGNHEFDFGKAVLEERVSEARFPILGANILGFDTVLKPYVTHNIAGIRVIIIGVVTDETPVTTDPRNVAGLKFLPPAETVEKYIRQLKRPGDIVVVLSHIGYAHDRALAEKVKGIDVIVGGHSHTKLERPVVVGDTIIVQAWEHAKALGVLDITVEDGRISGFEGHLDEIRPVGRADAAVEAIVDRYEKKVDSVLDEKVGYAEVGLDGEGVRYRETNFGDLIADIMRETAGADAAIINGGAIRTSVPQGEIRAKDIYSALPFDDYLVAVTLTGEQIREALEHGVSAVEQREGRFPQVSGIAFTYAWSAPPGRRVKQISIGGVPVDPKREYTVATNDFLAAGGDGYAAFGDAVKSSRDYSVTGGAMKGDNLVYSNAGRWLRDIVIQYIKGKKRVGTKVGKRIVELH